MHKIIPSLALALATALPAAAATYDIDLIDFGQAGASLTGTITFDSFGNVAEPSSFDLVYRFEPDPSSSSGPVIDLNSADHYFVEFGGDEGLFAGPTALTFDLSSSAFLAIADFAGISGSAIGFCIAGATAVIDFSSFGAQGCQGGSGAIDENSLFSTIPLSGTFTLGTIPAVPLPAGGVLLLTGLAGFGAMRRRKRPS